MTLRTTRIRAAITVALVLGVSSGALLGAVLKGSAAHEETTGAVSAPWSCAGGVASRCQRLKVIRALAFSRVGSCPFTTIVLANLGNDRVNAHLPPGRYLVRIVLAGERLVASSRDGNFGLKAGQNLDLGTLRPSMRSLPFPMFCD